jgi:hypothetical protein
VDVVSAGARDKITEALQIYANYDGDLGEKELLDEAPDETGESDEPRRKKKKKRK